MLRKIAAIVLGCLFFSAGIASAVEVNVKLLNMDGSAANGVTLWCVGFIDGEDEPNQFYTRVTTTSVDGLYTFRGLEIQNEYQIPIFYKIAFARHKVFPTLKEQIMMDNIPKIRFASQDDIVNMTEPGITLFQAPEQTTLGILKVNIASTSVLNVGDMISAELRHAISGEPVAFGMGKVNLQNDAGFSFYVVNVPPAPVNTYKLVVNKMGANEGAEVIVSTAIVNSSDISGATSMDITFGFISTARSEEEVTIDAENVAFEGFVAESGSGLPIPNCSVEVRDTQPWEDQGAYNMNFAKTITDGSGRFVVFKDAILTGRSYCIQISRLGYKSEFDNNQFTQSGYAYGGSRVILPKYDLLAATGVIRGIITLNGSGLPGAEVMLETEQDRSWRGPYVNTDFGGGFFRAVTRGDGSYDFIGLSPGTYNLRIHSPIFKKDAKYWHSWDYNAPVDYTQPWNFNYMYNYGDNQKADYTFENEDGTRDWTVYSDNWRADDDCRIVITSDTIVSRVYNSSGSVVESVVDNGNISVNIEIAFSSGCTITGALYYPSTDIPTKSNIVVIAHPIDPQTRNWTEWNGQDTAFYASQNEMVTSEGKLVYAIHASTGTYFVEIRSTDWVPARMYNFEVSLKETGAQWTLPDINMVKAGKLEGKVKLPDGSYFQAKEGNGYSELASIELRGQDVEFGMHSEINPWNGDPTRFTFDAVPSGKYSLWVEVKRRTFDNTSPNNDGTALYPLAIINNVRVYAGQATSLEAQIKDGILCEPIAPIPPDRPEVDYSSRSQDGTGFYGIVGFPSEITLKGAMLQALMNNKGKLDDIYVPMLNYNPSTKSWQTNRLFAGKYNFYMVFMRMFGAGESKDGMDVPANNPDEYMTIISRAENVIVKADDLMTGATFQIRMGAGTMGSGIVTGRMKGLKFLTADDGETIKGDMDEFMNYIPTAMLYDMDGNLRAYSAARPLNDIEELMKWDSTINSGNAAAINNMINSDEPGVSSPVHYYIDSVPLGKYVLVCETRNYPPVTKVITISTGTTTIDIDFDTQAPLGVTLGGRVVDENGNAISEANVLLAHRLVSKKVLTDSDGAFSVPGLPSGAYRIDVNKSGYSIGGTKVSLGITNVDNVEVTLKAAGASITGKIYVRESKLARKSIYTGAKVVAYNESENVANPTEYLPCIATKTENDGSYKIPDIILNNTYYVYAFVPERPVYYKRVYVSSATMENVNFDIQPSTPTLRVVMKRTENPYIFRFIIESPRPLISVPECYYSPGTTFDSTRRIRALPTPGAKNTYSLEVEIPENSDDEYYTLQINGRYGMSEYMKEEINFSQKFLARAKKEVADELAEGGSILIDDERADNTEVKLDAGSLTSEEMSSLPIGGFLTALPNFKMSKTGQNISLLMDTAMNQVAASDVYEIGLDKAQVNKPFDVTINYDRKKVSDSELEDLKVYRFNQSTGLWELIPGVNTVDPLTGTIAVETDQLQSTTPQQSAPRAIVKNGVFTINKAASTSQSGAFAVFKQDPNTQKIYSGSEFNVLCFPNPFNLKSKAVTLQDVTASPAQSVTGTMIKYNLPSDKTGSLKFYIYNLAGELVRELNEGSRTGGYYYYTEWDGKNDSGEECASGVYLLLAKLDGKKLNSKPLKIAILK